jgi:hypothetical protein
MEMVKSRLSRLLAGLALCLSLPAMASVVDYGPPTDALGHWEFDLYDAAGNQRGTSGNPLYTNRAWSLSSGTDSVTVSDPISTVSGTVTGTGTLQLSLDGHYGSGFAVTGTWSGSLVPEGLIGSTWSTLDVFSDIATGELVLNSITANGSYSFILQPGITDVRLRGVGVTGTASITITANRIAFAYPTYARGLGDPVGSYGVQIGGVNPSGLFQFQKVNDLGAAGVYIESSNKAAYKATITPVTPPATPTDIVNLCGSATKTVRIKKITLGATQTTQGINDWYLVKRSTANTGGTSTTITPVPLDSAFPASTTVLRRYTANPTLGTLVGNLSIENILSPVVAPGSSSATNYTPHTWDFANDPLVLHGTGECVAINLNGVALPAGLSVNTTFTFTEE